MICNIWATTHNLMKENLVVNLTEITNTSLLWANKHFPCEMMYAMPWRPFHSKEIIKDLEEFDYEGECDAPHHLMV